MIKKPLKRWSTIVLICFTLNTLSLPAQGLAVPAVSVSIPGEGNPAIPFELKIPPALGKIETLISGNGPAVIHIQEAHGSYEGQKQIFQILKLLKKNYGIKQVLLEGTAFKLHSDLLQLYPEDRERTLKDLDRLAKKSLVTGPEFLMAQDKEIESYGIEEIETYKENSRIFVSVLRQKEKTESFAGAMNAQMKNLASPYLNPELRAFLDRVESYELHEIPLDTWLDFLSSEAGKQLSLDFSNPWNQKDWPMLLRVFTLKKLEANFDKAAFEKERPEFLRAVRRFVPQDGNDLNGKISELLSGPLSSNQLSHPETSRLFESMVSSLPRDFNYTLFPHVNRFIGHLILASELAGPDFMKEMERLEEAITDKLARTEQEKKLAALFKKHRLLKLLFNLELTPENYETVLAEKETLNPQALTAEFLALNPEKRVKDKGFSHLAEITALFNEALEFYRLAKVRDEKMLEGIEKRLRETGENKAVVITGGFHSGPFTDYFRKKNYSYALITPQMNSADGHDRYVSLFLKNFSNSSPRQSELKDIPFVATLPAEMRRMDRSPDAIRDAITKELGSSEWNTARGSRFENRIETWEDALAHQSEIREKVIKSLREVIAVSLRTLPTVKETEKKEFLWHQVAFSLLWLSHITAENILELAREAFYGTEDVTIRGAALRAMARVNPAEALKLAEAENYYNERFDSDLDLVKTAVDAVLRPGNKLYVPEQEGEGSDIGEKLREGGFLHGRREIVGQDREDILRMMELQSAQKIFVELLLRAGDLRAVPYIQSYLRSEKLSHVEDAVSLSREVHSPALLPVLKAGVENLQKRIDETAAREHRDLATAAGWAGQRVAMSRYWQVEIALETALSGEREYGIENLRTWFYQHLKDYESVSDKESDPARYSYELLQKIARAFHELGDSENLETPLKHAGIDIGDLLRKNYDPEVPQKYLDNLEEPLDDVSNPWPGKWKTQHRTHAAWTLIEELKLGRSENRYPANLFENRVVQVSVLSSLNQSAAPQVLQLMESLGKRNLLHREKIEVLDPSRFTIRPVVAQGLQKLDEQQKIRLVMEGAYLDDCCMAASVAIFEFARRHPGKDIEIHYPVDLINYPHTFHGQSAPDEKIADLKLKLGLNGDDLAYQLYENGVAVGNPLMRRDVIAENLIHLRIYLWSDSNQMLSSPLLSENPGEEQRQPGGGERRFEARTAEALTALKSVLQEMKVPELEIFMFGSYADDKTRDGSDLDLILMIKEGTAQRRQGELIQQLSQLEKRLGDLLQARGYREIEWHDINPASLENYFTLWKRGEFFNRNQNVWNVSAEQIQGYKLSGGEIIFITLENYQAARLAARIDRDAATLGEDIASIQNDLRAALEAAERRAQTSTAFAGSDEFGLFEGTAVDPAASDPIVTIQQIEEFLELQKAVQFYFDLFEVSAGKDPRVQEFRASLGMIESQIERLQTYMGRAEMRESESQKPEQPKLWELEQSRAYQTEVLWEKRSRGTFWGLITATFIIAALSLKYPHAISLGFLLGAMSLGVYGVDAWLQHRLDREYREAFEHLQKKLGKLTQLEGRYQEQFQKLSDAHQELEDAMREHRDDTGPLMGFEHQMLRFLYLLSKYDDEIFESATPVHPLDMKAAYAWRLKVHEDYHELFQNALSFLKSLLFHNVLHETGFMNLRFVQSMEDHLEEVPALLRLLDRRIHNYEAEHPRPRFENRLINKKELDFPGLLQKVSTGNFENTITTLRAYLRSDAMRLERYIISTALAMKTHGEEQAFLRLIKTAALYLLDQIEKEGEPQVRMEENLKAFENLIARYNQAYPDSPSLSFPTALLMPLFSYFNEPDQDAFVAFRSRLHLLPGHYGIDAVAYDLLMTGMHLRGELQTADLPDLERIGPNFEFALRVLEEGSLDEFRRKYLESALLKFILAAQPVLIPLEDWGINDPENPFYYMTFDTETPETERQGIWEYQKTEELRELIQSHQAIVRPLLQQFAAEPREFQRRFLGAQFYMWKQVYEGLRDHHIREPLESSWMRFINGEASAAGNIAIALSSENFSRTQDRHLLLSEIETDEKYMEHIDRQLKFLAENPESFFKNRAENRELPPEIENYGLSFTPVDALYFSGTGDHYRLFEKLGAHPVRVAGEQIGTYFAVWAPNASTVNVVGDFNDWSILADPLEMNSSGVWTGFSPKARIGNFYKYVVGGPDGSYLMDPDLLKNRYSYVRAMMRWNSQFGIRWKADPFAFYSQYPTGDERQRTASIITELDYQWNDGIWLGQREQIQADDQPISIYEMHLGSWVRPLTYREIAPRLVDYLKRTGYTHVEFMPPTEHYYEPSWGYQVANYFAPTSRFGTPQDFMYLIDMLHQHGIGVIMDWVPAHFPKDDAGLNLFDGTELYAYENPVMGDHPHWGTKVFDYAKPEVRSFLLSSAYFWARRYHFDGIRVDGVASMLYRNYGRDGVYWSRNEFGGMENLEAITLLQDLNFFLEQDFPGILMMAEESSAWQGVSSPYGLGFRRKQALGWMNDAAKVYMKTPPHDRPHRYDDIIRYPTYALSEKFVLPLSHDEVTHGKGPLFDQMPGSYYERLLNLKLLYANMFTMPGNKLLFMGNEFGQTREWNDNEQLQWEHLQDFWHKSLAEYVRDLNLLYRTLPALHELDFNREGFEWIHNDDRGQSVMSFLRKGRKPEDTLLVVFNFSNRNYPQYQIGAPSLGKWYLIFSSNDPSQSGVGTRLGFTLEAGNTYMHGRPYSLNLNIPMLSVQVFSQKPDAAKALEYASEVQAPRAEMRETIPVTLNGKRYAFEAQPQGEIAVGVTDPRAADLGFPAGRQVGRYAAFYDFMNRVLGDDPPPFLPNLRNDQKRALLAAIDVSQRNLGMAPFDQLWNSLPLAERNAVDLITGTFFNEEEIRRMEMPDVRLSRIEASKKRIAATANYYLKLFVIRFMKDPQFRQMGKNYLQAERQKWKNPEIARRLVPMQLNAVIGPMSNGADGIVVPEDEIRSLLKLFDKAKFLNRRLAFRDSNGRWGKDLQNLLPEIPGRKRYALKYLPSVELPAVEFPKLFEPAEIAKFEKIGMIQEGGTSIPGVAETPFMILSDSIPQRLINDFKQAVAQLPGYQDMKIYVFPSAYVPFNANGELLFLLNDHIDTVMDFFPGSFLQDGRPALWISPEYHQELEMREDPEWKRFLEEQKVKVVDIVPEEVKYAPANTVHAADTIFTNYAPRSLEMMNLKPDARVFSISEPEKAFQVLHCGGGSMGCLAFTEPVTSDNVSRYPLRGGAPIMNAAEGYEKTLEAQNGQTWPVRVGDIFINAAQNQRMKVIAIAEDGLSFDVKMLSSEGVLDNFTHNIVRPFFVPFFAAFPGHIRFEKRDDEVPEPSALKLSQTEVPLKVISWNPDMSGIHLYTNENISNLIKALADSPKGGAYLGLGSFHNLDIALAQNAEAVVLVDFDQNVMTFMQKLLNVIARTDFLDIRRVLKEEGLEEDVLNKLAKTPRLWLEKENYYRQVQEWIRADKILLLGGDISSFETGREINAWLTEQNSILKRVNLSNMPTFGPVRAGKRMQLNSALKIFVPQDAVVIEAVDSALRNSPGLVITESAQSRRFNHQITTFAEYGRSRAEQRVEIIGEENIRFTDQRAGSNEVLRNAVMKVLNDPNRMINAVRHFYPGRSRQMPVSPQTIVVTVPNQPLLGGDSKDYIPFQIALDGGVYNLGIYAGKILPQEERLAQLLASRQYGPQIDERIPVNQDSAVMLVEPIQGTTVLQLLQQGEVEKAFETQFTALLYLFDLGIQNADVAKRPSNTLREINTGKALIVDPGMGTAGAILSAESILQDAFDLVRVYRPGYLNTQTFPVLQKIAEDLITQRIASGEKRKMILLHMPAARLEYGSAAPVQAQVPADSRRAAQEEAIREYWQLFIEGNAGTLSPELSKKLNDAGLRKIFSVRFTNAQQRRQLLVTGAGAEFIHETVVNPLVLFYNDENRAIVNHLDEYFRVFAAAENIIQHSRTGGAVLLFESGDGTSLVAVIHDGKVMNFTDWKEKRFSESGGKHEALQMIETAQIHNGKKPSFRMLSGNWKYDFLGGNPVPAVTPATGVAALIDLPVPLIPRAEERDRAIHQFWQEYLDRKTTNLSSPAFEALKPFGFRAAFPVRFDSAAHRADVNRTAETRERFIEDYVTHPMQAITDAEGHKLLDELKELELYVAVENVIQHSKSGGIVLLFETEEKRGLAAVIHDGKVMSFSDWKRNVFSGLGSAHSGLKFIEASQTRARQNYFLMRSGGYQYDFMGGEPVQKATPASGVLTLVDISARAEARPENLAFAAAVRSLDPSLPQGYQVLHAIRNLFAFYSGKGLNGFTEIMGNILIPENGDLYRAAHARVVRDLERLEQSYGTDGAEVEVENDGLPSDPFEAAAAEAQISREIINPAITAEVAEMKNDATLKEYLETLFAEQEGRKGYLENDWLVSAVRETLVTRRNFLRLENGKLRITTTYWEDAAEQLQRAGRLLEENASDAMTLDSVNGMLTELVELGFSAAVLSFLKNLQEPIPGLMAEADIQEINRRIARAEARNLFSSIVRAFMEELPEVIQDEDLKFELYSELQGKEKNAAARFIKHHWGRSIEEMYGFPKTLDLMTAFYKGKLVGSYFFQIAGSQANGKGIHVIESFRRKGIGRRLRERLFRTLLEQKGVDKFYFAADTNREAQGFHREIVAHAGVKAFEERRWEIPGQPLMISHAIVDLTQFEFQAEKALPQSRSENRVMQKRIRTLVPEKIRAALIESFFRATQKHLRSAGEEAHFLLSLLEEYESSGKLALGEGLATNPIFKRTKLQLLQNTISNPEAFAFLFTEEGRRWILQFRGFPYMFRLAIFSLARDPQAVRELLQPDGYALRSLQEMKADLDEKMMRVNMLFERAPRNTSDMRTIRSEVWREEKIEMLNRFLAMEFIKRFMFYQNAGQLPSADVLLKSGVPEEIFTENRVMAQSLQDLSLLILQEIYRINEEALITLYGTPDSKAAVVLGGSHSRTEWPTFDFDSVFVYEKEGNTSGGVQGSLTNQEFYNHLARLMGTSLSGMGRRWDGDYQTTMFAAYAEKNQIDPEFPWSISLDNTHAALAMDTDNRHHRAVRFDLLIPGAGDPEVARKFIEIAESEIEDERAIKRAMVLLYRSVMEPSPRPGQQRIDIKEDPGGLRTIHYLLWFARLMKRLKHEPPATSGDTISLLRDVFPPEVAHQLEVYFFYIINMRFELDLFYAKNKKELPLAAETLNYFIHDHKNPLGSAVRFEEIPQEDTEQFYADLQFALDTVVTMSKRVMRAQFQQPNAPVSERQFRDILEDIKRREQEPARTTEARNWERDISAVSAYLQVHRRLGEALADRAAENLAHSNLAEFERLLKLATGRNEARKPEPAKKTSDKLTVAAVESVLAKLNITDLEVGSDGENITISPKEERFPTGHIIGELVNVRTSLLSYDYRRGGNYHFIDIHNTQTSDPEVRLEINRYRSEARPETLNAVAVEKILRFNLSEILPYGYRLNVLESSLAAYVNAEEGNLEKYFDAVRRYRDRFNVVLPEVYSGFSKTAAPGFRFSDVFFDYDALDEDYFRSLSRPRPDGGGVYGVQLNVEKVLSLGDIRDEILRYAFFHEAGHALFYSPFRYDTPKDDFLGMMAYGHIEDHPYFSGLQFPFDQIDGLHSDHLSGVMEAVANAVAIRFSGMDAAKLGFEFQLSNLFRVLDSSGPEVSPSLHNVAQYVAAANVFGFPQTAHLSRAQALAASEGTYTSMLETFIQGVNLRSRAEGRTLERESVSFHLDAAETMARYFTGFLIMTKIREVYGSEVFETLVRKLARENGFLEEAPEWSQLPPGILQFLNSQNGNLLRDLFASGRPKPETERIIHLRDTEALLQQGVSVLGVEILFAVLNPHTEYIIIGTDRISSETLLTQVRDYARSKFHMKLGDNFKVIAAEDGDLLGAAKARISKEIKTTIIADENENRRALDSLEELPVFAGAQVMRLVDDAHLTGAQELLLGADLLKATNEQIYQMVQKASRHLDGRFSGLLVQIQAFTKFLQAA